MKREPAVIFHHHDGRTTTVIHGTEMRARRNATILGEHQATFTWVEVPNVFERLAAWWKNRASS